MDVLSEDGMFCGIDIGLKKEGSVVSHAPTVAFLDLRILERPGPFFCYTLQTFHHSARQFTKSSTPFMLKVVLYMFNS